MAYRRWIPADDKRLLELRAKGHDWATIGRRLDRRAQSCATRHRFLSGPVEQKPILSVAEIEAQHWDDAGATQIIRRRDELNDRREARDLAAMRSGNLTPVICGDPPPGRSALDRRGSL